MLQITLSNQIERLLDHFKEKLMHRAPFDAILVVVPGLAIKNWLLRSIASDPAFNVAFGLKILSLNEAIFWLIDSKGKRLPHLIELALLIDQELQQKHGEERPYDALEIAKLFQHYGEFAVKEMEHWFSHPPAGWEQGVWLKIFENDSLEPLYRILSQAQLVETPEQVHLFGFSSMSAVKHQFFEELSQNVNCYAWILSPSRMLWSDLKTKSERFRLEARNPTQDWMEEDNSLMANNGRFARPWRKELEELPDIKERFLISSALLEHPAYRDTLFDGIETLPSAALSLLHAVQADLVVLRSAPFKERVELPEGDSSIEIHCSCSIQREVEALYQTLLGTLKNERLQPGDILVFVPQVEKYAPFIRSIFTNTEQPIPVEIAESSSLLDHPFIRAVFNFLQLVESRWGIHEVMELIQQPYIRLPNPISSDDLRELVDLFKKQGIYWGRSGIHRKEGERGSWDWGWEELVKSFAVTISPEEFLKHPSISRVTIAKAAFSQGEVLGALIENLQILTRDLGPLSTKPQRTASEWSSFLLDLMERYFICFHSEDEEFSQQLKRLLSQFKEWKCGTKCSLASFVIYLQEMCQQHRLSLSERQLNAVHVASLGPTRLAPAPVTVLMGMNNEEFPRPNRRNPFDGLPNHTLIPSPNDEDRFLFLESLVITSKKWILSYVARAPEPPSVLIQELIQYLDERYTIGGKLPSEKILYKHPALAFDLHHPQHTQRAYCNANALINPPALHFGEMFGAPIPSQNYSLDLLPLHINLSEFKKAFYHPLKHYMNRKLNLYLHSPILPHPLFEELEEEHLWDGEWLKWAVRYPIERVLDLADRMGKWPIHPWNDVSKQMWRQKLEGWLEKLKEVDISPDEIFEVEFAHGVAAPIQISSGRWRVPALKLIYRGRKVELTGILPYVCAKGIILLQDPKFETAITSLPERMFHHALPESISAKTIHYLKKQKSEPAQGTVSWDHLLDHYLCILHQAAPFFPSWIKPLLDNQPEQLKKAIQQTFDNPYREDPYLKRFTRQIDAIDSQSIIANWKDHAERIFGNLEQL